MRQQDFLVYKLLRNFLVEGGKILQKRNKTAGILWKQFF